MASNFRGCDCDMRGTKVGYARCDSNTKQCDCKCSIQGLRCDECTDMHYNFPNCENTCKNISKISLYSDAMCM